MHKVSKAHRAMRIVLAIGILLMVVKFAAWLITNSNAILTDALESIINVGAAAFALYSIKLAETPRDKNHPYGHGKVEFFAAGFEGGLIIVAGLVTMGKAMYGFFFPEELAHLTEGMVLTTIAGIVNMLMGFYLVRLGKNENSITLSSDGKHLLTDALTSGGLLVGLAIIIFSKIYWLDNVIAISLAFFILITGYKLMRKSIAGLMDETDFQLVQTVVGILNKNRKASWIDCHNMRIQQYGNALHIDCHVTLPYYLSLEEAHSAVKAIENILHQEMENSIEIFIHTDPCEPKACGICAVENCKVRKFEFEQQVEWTLENVTENRQHE